jgi:hypothetical protein
MAGMPNSWATIAAWEAGVPRSVTTRDGDKNSLSGVVSVRESGLVCQGKDIARYRGSELLR